MPFRLIHRSLPKPKWTEITENVSYTQNNPLWEELTCFLLKEDFFLTSDIGVHLQKAGGKLPAGDGVHHRCCFNIRFSLTKKLKEVIRQNRVQSILPVSAVFAKRGGHGR